eukprot:scaffold125740_cov50-Attheya_sp.AAC.4
MSTEKTIQRILVTGASGYVGQHLLQYLCQTEPPASIAKREIVAWSSTSSTLVGLTPCMAKGVTMEGGIIEAVDLTNSVSVTEALARLSSPVHVVVHLAAISGLQACQDDPVCALATNHPTILWEALPNTTRVIAMSTDQVYDGFHPPYSEADASSETLSPINVYGETKLAMEQGLVELFPQQCVILRSSLILGSPAVHSKKQSFVQFLETQLLEKKETNVFTDEYRSVVSVTNVVQVISYFLEHNKESPGIYNMGGSESVNRWDIALAVHRQLWGDDDHETIPCNLHGIERSKLPKQPNSAPSPPNLTMEIGKLQTLLQSAGIQLWGLNDTIHHCNLSRPQL